MREIVFDTETTGISPSDGHKLVEIGALELRGHMPTGKTLQIYINPQRSMPKEAEAVHGITEKFLADKPIFSQVYQEFLDFIGDDSKLIAHNANFDMGFLNYELKLVGHKGLDKSRVIDTLAIARKKFPGSPANLDALCRRFGIDISGRDLHGALLDSRLLADVYLELIGGRQRGLGLSELAKKDENSSKDELENSNKKVRERRTFKPSEGELKAHESMLEDIKNPVWRKKD